MEIAFIVAKLAIVQETALALIIDNVVQIRQAGYQLHGQR